VRRVRVHLPAAVALADLFIAEPLLVVIEYEQRCVDERDGVGTGQVLDPADGRLDAARPSGGGDGSVWVECGDAGLVDDLGVAPREVDPERSHSQPDSHAERATTPLPWRG
jgi:hypothetical protein